MDIKKFLRKNLETVIKFIKTRFQWQKQKKITTLDHARTNMQIKPREQQARLETAKNWIVWA